MCVCVCERESEREWGGGFWSPSALPLEFLLDTKCLSVLKIYISAKKGQFLFGHT